jgi:hypothetical protein
MKNTRNYLATSTPTLTQSGLLAELLRHQRRRMIQLKQRRAHRQQRRGFFENSLTWVLARAHSVTAGRRFRRGFEKGTLSRPT